jgi:YVTN family beta-propeller protein
VLITVPISKRFAGYVRFLSIVSCLAASDVVLGQQGPGGANEKQDKTPSADTAYTRTLTQNGVNVRLRVYHVDRSKTERDPLVEGEPVHVRFELADAATDSPISGASLGAWIDHKPDGQKTRTDQCAGEVKRFVEASAFSRAEVDLTSFHVAILNDDPSITVVDPRFGYGDTRLLAEVLLESPGEDWALTSDGTRLFVSLPQSDKVAVIDTASWKVIGNVNAGSRPARVVLQPDEAYLWVGYGADAEDSGVSVVGVHELKTVARIPTGHGYHQIAFGSDSALAFVTNPKEGSVTVVNVRSLATRKDIPVGRNPVSIVFSALAQAAYVTNEGDGTIVAIDGKALRVIARMETVAGLGQIRLTPNGRFAIALNPANDHAYVLDTASNRVIQTGKLDKEPDQLCLTNKQIHVRHRGSDAVLMIALDSLGVEGAPLSVADFSGGRHPPGKMARPTPADGLVQASGENGVLVANPGDKAVYLYMEGMAAPMGSFSNYGHEPRAVLAVERNLRERSPGVYETTVKLPEAGSYDVAFLVDVPKIVSCFDLPISPDPARAALKQSKLQIESRSDPTGSVGQPVHLRFRVTDAGTNAPEDGIADIVVLVEAPGLWQRRQVARSAGDGVYTVEYIVPVPGVYSVFLASASKGLNYALYSTVTILDGPH